VVDHNLTRACLTLVKRSGHGHRSTIKVWTEEESSSNLSTAVRDLSFMLVRMVALLVIGRASGGRPPGARAC
jgi:hypothetical protein